MKEIHTERLFLRKPELADSEKIFNLYAKDEEVVKYLTWKPHNSIEETKAFLNSVLERIENKRDYVYVIEEKNSNNLIGMIDIRIKRAITEMGYVLAKEYWGKGFMTEAVTSTIKKLFESNNFNIIKTFCDIENIGSKRVLEKSGFKLVALREQFLIHPNIDDQPRDCFVFSIDRNSYFYKLNIASNKRKNKFSSEELIDIIKFQNDQIESFMSDSTLKEFNEFLISLNENNFEIVMNTTTLGIKRGVNKYLKDNNGYCIYWVDGGHFYYDETIFELVLNELRKLNLKVKNLEIYSKYISQSFHIFIYNESMEKYKEKFG